METIVIWSLYAILDGEYIYLCIKLEEASYEKAYYLHSLRFGNCAVCSHLGCAADTGSHNWVYSTDSYDYPISTENWQTAVWEPNSETTSFHGTKTKINPAIQWTFDAASSTLTISGSGKICLQDGSDDLIGINAPWEKHRAKIKSVKIKQGVTSVTDYLFHSYPALTTVSIPASMQMIGEEAFAYCGKLKNITIASGVKTIEYNAFMGCTALQEITIPGSIKSLGNSIFCGCINLKKVTMKNGIESIEYGTFDYCTKLATIIFPDSLLSVEDDAFCFTKWQANQKNGIIYAGKVIYSVKGKLSGNITLKAGTKAIADLAFHNQNNITGIKIPNGVQKIGRYAFVGCTKLASVSMPSTIEQVGFDIFEDTKWYQAQPNGVVYAGTVVCGVKGTVKGSYTIKKGTTAIADGSFWDQQSLTTVSVPGSVKIIPREAFAICEKLKEVTLGEGVTSIEYDAFINCNRLEKITFPKSLKTIGRWAFYGCSGLQTLKIGSGVTLIDEGAFCECSKLSNLEIAGSVKTICDEAFLGCTKLKTVTIPSNVTTIGVNAFGYKENYSVQKLKYFGINIKGYTSTAAEKYAIANKIRFTALTPVALTAVKFKTASGKLGVKQTLQLSLVVTSTNATYRYSNYFTFKSSNTDVATVSSAGKITAKKAGKTTVTATNKLNSKLVVKYQLTVLAEPTAIKQKKEKITLGLGESYQSGITTTPAGAQTTCT